MPASKMRAALGCRRVAAEPVVGARQLPRGLEIARGRRASSPRHDSRRAPRARQVRAIGVERVRVVCGRHEPRPRARYRIGQMQDLIRQLLADLGEDPTAKGLRDTPKRVEKAFKFLTSGYDADIDDVLNNALFTVDYSEMVIVKDIDFYSLCEHHLLPFFGKCHVAYIPSTKVIGLEQDPAARRRVRAAAAGAGAADESDRRHDPREDRAARRRRRHGSDAPVHVDARRREAELVRGDERDARCVPRQLADADGIPRTDLAAQARYPA